MEQLLSFNAQIVENGWIVRVNNPAPGYIGKEYIFRTLEDLADWLKVQVTRDTLREG